MLIMLLNYIIDPLRLYHDCTDFRLNQHNKILFYGKLKNFDYDSIIIGQSTAWNYNIKLLNDNFHSSFILVASSDSSSYDFQRLLSHALKYKKNIKTIIYELGFWSFSGDTDKSNLPTKYLYSDTTNPFISSLKYLSDSTVIHLTINVLVGRMAKRNYYGVIYEPECTQHNGAVDDDYKYRPEQYCYNNAINAFNSLVFAVNDGTSNLYYNDKDYVTDVMMHNLNENLLGLIAKNPNIKFIIFHPPYSILHFVYLKYYKPMIYKHYIEFKCNANKILSQYPNVEIYDFQNATNITTRLDKYCDTHHFNRDASEFVENNLKNSKYKVNNINKCQINGL
ncbi:MAG: hypothetical protein HQK92_02200 [Nitrospirae bacterium]|nr:hypothetical protein [Nitrospirota bacterium]